MKSPGRSEFFDMDYHYKLVAIQIIQDAKLVPICPTPDRTQERCMRGSNSVSASQRQTTSYMYKFRQSRFLDVQIAIIVHFPHNGKLDLDN